jgi:hypothetical protein
MMTLHDSSTMTYAAEDRARQSRGTSSQGILDMVNRAMERRGLGGACVVDVGCGATALLEVDLRRIAAECGLEQIEIEYSGQSRIPGMARHYPEVLSRRFPQALSDNVLLIGRRADRK